MVDSWLSFLETDPIITFIAIATPNRIAENEIPKIKLRIVAEFNLFF
jgi:hypothetical protein